MAFTREFYFISFDHYIWMKNENVSPGISGWDPHTQLCPFLSAVKEALFSDHYSPRCLLIGTRPPCNRCFKYYHVNLYTYRPTICKCPIAKNTSCCRLTPTLRTTEDKLFFFFFCFFRDHRLEQADRVHFFHHRVLFPQYGIMPPIIPTADSSTSKTNFSVIFQTRPFAF